MNVLPALRSALPGSSGSAGDVRRRAPGEDGAGGLRRGTRRLASSGWPPAVAVTLLAAVVSAHYGVSARDIAAFGVYLVFGLALPGTLLVRALYRGSRTFAEEVALGTALGYAVEVPAYIAARAAGTPLAVALWPAVTYAVFLAVPRLRRHWKGGSRRRPPVWWPWSIALTVAFLIAWSALAFFRSQAITWPGLADSRLDMPFHLALVGELRHHMPPSTPWFDGDPLYYHWFVYAHMAAAGRLTGVEPVILLFRLAMLPMLAVLVILMAMIGRRLMRSWGGASVAAVSGIFVAAPSLYLGPNPKFTWGGLQDTAWSSPTQTFGAMLFAPVALSLVEILRHGRRPVGGWILPGVFLVAVMGAKATYLPLVAAGLAAVVVTERIRSRRWCRPALAALGAVAGCLLFAQLVLFGLGRQGMVIYPLSFVRLTWSELAGPDHGAAGTASILGFTAVYLLSWAVAWCGVLGLLSRPRLVLRPDVVLLLGIGAAGLGAVLLLGHAGLSQLYFLRGAYPYVVLVAVHGLLTLLRRVRMPLRATAGAIAAGATAAYLLPFACGVRVPLAPGEPGARLYLPWAALLALIVLVPSVLLATGMSGPRALAFTLVMVTAIGLPAAGHARVLSFLSSGSLAYSPEPGRLRQATAVGVPSGEMAAGRWLRDHSDPDDVVATNVHCRWGYENPCDARQFWAAALTERHMLVEGWAYSPVNLDHWNMNGSPSQDPFWDAGRMRANEAVFHTPSPAAIRELRERYGVRWIFADESRLAPQTRLGEFTSLRFRSGDYAVYRVVG
ncbi:DUF2298 domain-containing protein [Streptosporangium sp. NPDC048047]|uniref:DUF2298 domain-containing protein n=1 Tax=Streptosporangium sp. NPDC048047 TaxID=3155748 RepID=UPI0034238C94